jgi:hypothetical protein
MDVPAGRYIVSLGSEYGSIAYDYSRNGLLYGNRPPDTLLVDEGHSPLAVDFNLASMRVQLDVSPHLDGEWGGIRLFLRDGTEPAPWQRSYQRLGSAQILNGGLSVELSAILPGQYKIQVVLGNRVYADFGTTQYGGEYLWMPGVRDSAEATWTSVSADQTVDVQGQLSSQPARIQGEIRGAWRNLGLGQPSLALVNPDSQLVRGFRIIGSDGRFDEEIYLPEPVKLAVGQDRVVQWIGGDSFETAQVFDLSPGGVTSGIVFTQSGILIELQAPYTTVDFASVRFYRAADMTLAAEWSPTQSGFGPMLPIGNVKPGSYLVQIEPSLRGWYPWVAQWYDRSYAASRATPVTISSLGEVVQLAITLERGGTISGTVHDSQLVEEGYSFFVTTANDPQQWGSHYTFDKMGGFIILGLPDGDWKIGVLREHQYPDVAPEETIWFPGVSEWNSAGIIATSGFGDVTGVDIVMPAQR